MHVCVVQSLKLFQHVNIIHGFVQLPKQDSFEVWGLTNKSPAIISKQALVMVWKAIVVFDDKHEYGKLEHSSQLHACDMQPSIYITCAKTLGCIARTIAMQAICTQKNSIKQHTRAFVVSL